MFYLYRGTRDSPWLTAFVEGTALSLRMRWIPWLGRNSRDVKLLRRHNGFTRYSSGSTERCLTTLLMHCLKLPGANCASHEQHDRRVNIECTGGL